MNKNKDDNPRTVMLGLTVFYSIAGFVSFAVAEDSQGFTVTLTAGIVFGTLQMMSAWSVFGNDSLIRRQAGSLVAGLVVAGGIVLAILVTALRFSSPDDSLLPILFAGILFMIPAWVASQLVYALFRFFCGWQFIAPDSVPRSSTFSISELMLITALIAVAVTAPRLAAGLTATEYEEAFAGFNTIATEFDPVTGQPVNAPEPVDYNSMWENQMFQSAGILALIAAGVTLFAGLPILLIMMRTKVESGCATIAGIAIVLTIVIFVGFAAAFGGGMPAEGIVYLGGWITASAAAFAIPLAALRNYGFVLLSSGQYLEQRAEKDELKSKHPPYAIGFDSPRQVDPSSGSAAANESVKPSSSQKPPGGRAAEGPTPADPRTTEERALAEDAPVDPTVDPPVDPFGDD